LKEFSSIAQVCGEAKKTGELIIGLKILKQKNNLEFQ
jgi:hypothetical protein